VSATMTTLGGRHACSCLVKMQLLFIERCAPWRQEVLGLQQLMLLTSTKLCSMLCRCALGSSCVLSGSPILELSCHVFCLV
jgi:hypothetical protein